MSAPAIEPTSLLSLDPAGDLSAGHARRWLRAELVVRAMPAGLVEDVVLVVSELVTNSAKYVGGRIVVGLIVGEGELRVMVQDDGILPLLPNHSDEGGRGLVIAATLAGSVSYEQCAKVKRFTCTFPLEEMAA